MNLANTKIPQNILYFFETSLYKFSCRGASVLHPFIYPPSRCWWGEPPIRTTLQGTCWMATRYVHLRIWLASTVCGQIMLHWTEEYSQERCSTQDYRLPHFWHGAADVRLRTFRWPALMGQSVLPSSPVSTRQGMWFLIFTWTSGLSPGITTWVSSLREWQQTLHHNKSSITKHDKY